MDIRLKRVLLVLGSPIWFTLGISLLAVVFSLYVSAWAVIASLWATFGSLVACAFGGLVSGILFVCTGDSLPGLWTIACGIICAGLSIFFFYGCKAITHGLVMLTKKTGSWFQQHFMRKEDVQ